MKIKDGDVLTVFGEKRVFSAMEIKGMPEFLDRRARDKIKREFLIRARGIMRGMPAAARPRRVCIKDTRSRWGSCSVSGTISLSWRLAFAPPDVMRYVIIHECCHFAEMNHSPAFWRLVGSFMPDYKAPREWLRRNGRRLFEI